MDFSLSTAMTLTSGIDVAMIEFVASIVPLATVLICDVDEELPFLAAKEV